MPTTLAHRRAAAFPDAKDASLPIAKPYWGCVYVPRDALELAAAITGEALHGRVIEAALEAALTRPGFAHRLAATRATVPGEEADNLAELVGSHPEGRRALEMSVVGNRPLRVLIDGR